MYFNSFATPENAIQHGFAGRFLFFERVDEPRSFILHTKATTTFNRQWSLIFMFFSLHNCSCTNTYQKASALTICELTLRLLCDTYIHFNLYKHECRLFKLTDYLFKLPPFRVRVRKFSLHQLLYYFLKQH